MNVFLVDPIIFLTYALLIKGESAWNWFYIHSQNYWGEFMLAMNAGRQLCIMHVHTSTYMYRWEMGLIKHDSI